MTVNRILATESLECESHTRTSSKQTAGFLRKSPKLSNETESDRVADLQGDHSFFGRK